ncbi:hypothetical protein [Methylocapsa acidiphila]|uniref:hypothetical protein n=1 Tax=Methylocapsa acidiphila TaxID=133552 RepID=UPI0003F79DF2|nr:hypothetical protein [Methylocapsa acidiphila]
MSIYEAFVIVIYVCSFALFAVVFAQAALQSEFGVFIIFADLPLALALCVYPILMASGMIDPGIEGVAFLTYNPAPGVTAAFHILLFAFGSFVGFNIPIRGDVTVGAHKIVQFGRATIHSWRKVQLVGIFIWILFFLLVGWDTAIRLAIFARAGEIEGFGEDQRWLFIKTIGTVFVALSASSVPLHLIDKSRDLLSVALHILLVIILYINSYSRNYILLFLIIPIVVHIFSLRGVLPLLVGAGVALAIGVPVLLYTKSLGYAAASLVSEGVVGEIEGYQQSDSFIETFLRSNEAQWYSVQAGINQFVATGGPTVPVDLVLAAIFGIVPSRILSYFGLDYLYYGSLADNSLTCVNTKQFGMYAQDTACTIPPFWAGFSAYTIPIFGGFIFGFVRFYIWGYLTKLWVLVKSVEPRSLWVVYFLAIQAWGVFLLVPSQIAVIVFSLVMLHLIRMATGSLMRS